MLGPMPATSKPPQPANSRVNRRPKPSVRRTDSTKRSSRDCDASKGVNPADLLQQTGVDVTAQPALQGLLDTGRCEWVDGQLRIPEAQWPLGDAITLDLMV